MIACCLAPLSYIRKDFSIKIRRRHVTKEPIPDSVVAGAVAREGGAEGCSAAT
jgi:hypothetical protein